MNNPYSLYLQSKYYNYGLYSCTLVRSGNIGEVLIYDNPQKVKYSLEKVAKKTFPKYQAKIVFPKKRIKQYFARSKRSIVRTQKNFRRLVWANTDLKYFWTLTFKENISDPKICHLEFRNFIKRCRRKYGVSFKYLAIFEKQKRGALHYHLIVNQRLAKMTDLDELWRQGSTATNAERVKDNGAIAQYLVKYLAKSLVDNFIPHSRCYFFSNNLVRFFKCFMHFFDFSNVLVLKEKICYNKFRGHFISYLIKFLE